MTTPAVPNATPRVAVGAGLVAFVTTATLLAGRIRRSFDYDESVSVAQIISRGSPVGALTESVVFNNHLLFSVGQSTWWALGGVGEARQRVLPILYGALAVALLVAWVARRWSLVAGVVAGAVVALNPMFVEQSRSVRGYSLSVLGVTVAVIALVEYVQRRPEAPRWWLLVHGAGAFVAVGTHAYATVPLLGVGVGCLVGRVVDRRLLVTWGAAIAATVLVYVPTAADLRRAARDRGTRWQPEFGRLTMWEVLGRDRLTAVVVGSAAVAGVVLIARGRGRWSVVAPVGAGVVVAVALGVWLLARPADLFARFFVTLVPLVALAAARVVRRVPATAAVIGVALAFTVPNVLDARDQEVPLRDVAAVVDRVRAAGRTPCVVGSESLGAYTVVPDELLPLDDLVPQFDACDVVVSIGSWGRPMWSAATETYGEPQRIAGTFRVWGATAGELAPSDLVR